ncbi:MAG TPA: hypothetical protein VFE37_13615 [Chloroflexota bacterium]|nr:hypothetical protein [Chloroflexota bacterium]
MGQLRLRAITASIASAGLLAATALPGLAQGPPAPEQPTAAPTAPASAPPATTGASQPAAQPDVALTAALHIAELRFNEPPQASIQVVVQPQGQPLVDLQLDNVPRAPQLGTTYRGVAVRLTVTGVLADVALGSAMPGGAATGSAPAPTPTPTTQP